MFSQCVFLFAEVEDSIFGHLCSRCSSGRASLGEACTAREPTSPFVIKREKNRVLPATTASHERETQGEQAVGRQCEFCASLGWLPRIENHVRFSSTCWVYGVTTSEPLVSPQPCNASPWC